MHSVPQTPTFEPFGSTIAEQNMAKPTALDRLIAQAGENGGLLIVNEAVLFELERVLLETL